MKYGKCAGTTSVNSNLITNLDYDKVLILSSFEASDTYSAVPLVLNGKLGFRLFTTSNGNIAFTPNTSRTVYYAYINIAESPSEWS